MTFWYILPDSSTFRYATASFGFAYPSLYRWDGVYVFENESTADAHLELKITNPSNKVVFEKVNTEGQVLKPTLDAEGKVTKGAKFTLEKNDGTIENPAELGLQRLIKHLSIKMVEFPIITLKRACTD